MSGSPWENATLCHCGKRGWVEKVDVTRAFRIMRGRARKDPRQRTLSIYQCDRTGSGLWHVGHSGIRRSI